MSSASLAAVLPLSEAPLGVQWPSVSAREEWESQAPAVARFREERAALDRLLAGGPSLPEQDTINALHRLIVAPARRLPLNATESAQASAWLDFLRDAAERRSSGGYSRGVAGALLYHALPRLAPLEPALLEPWVAPLISGAMIGQALVGVGDNEAATQAALNVCVDLAESLIRHRITGTLTGGADAWPRWLHALGFGLPPMTFYSTALNLKRFSAVFGGLRGAAYRSFPADPARGDLRLLGDLPKRPATNARWRIGLLCNNPHMHAHGLPDFIWWLAALDRTLFEPVLIIHRNPGKEDAIESFLEKHKSAVLRYAPVVVVDDAALPALESLRFDLIYTFAGLCWAVNDRIAHVRMTPRHMTTFYTAATTGGSAIDYFLTSAALDPHGQDGFTEQVTLCRDLPFCFHFASYFNGMPTEAPRDPAIPEGAVVYSLGAAVLNKWRPEYLDALIAILKQVPDSVIVAMPSNRVEERVVLMDSILRRCAGEGLDPDRFRFHPHARRSDLYRMIAGSDVFLDFFPFSGVNNIIDPVSVGVPPVVLFPPDGYSRNRIGGVVMEKMGLNDLMTTTPEAFAALAVELGRDDVKREVWKRQLGRERLRGASFFDGAAFIAGIEEVFASLLPDGPARLAARTPKDRQALEAALDSDFRDFASDPQFC